MMPDPPRSTERLVALVTEDRYVQPSDVPSNWYFGNILREDELVSQALAPWGYATRRLSWSDPSVRWSDFGALVIRSTWDYFDRYAEFRRWLDAREQDSHVVNRPDLLRWNMDKHYLADLAGRGIPIVPTHFLEQGTSPDLAPLLAQLPGPEGILKPCVSGAARHTYRLRRDDLASWQRLIEELLPLESLMVQPFQENILTEGELTLIGFGGQVTHAVRKRAKAGDYRVQDDHGGTVEQAEPTPEEVAFAERAFRVCDPLPVYGRVDLVRDARGELRVMELELVEPELWLRFLGNAELFAETLVQHLKSHGRSRFGRPHHQ